MSEDGGWVKLYRSIRKWEWWDDINCYRLFTYCLMMANTSERRWKGIVVGRGSFVTSYARLSAETTLTVHQVRTALEHLKSTSELASRAANKYTVITVCNYERYQEPQPGRGQTGGQGDGKQTAGRGQANGNKQELKNGRSTEDVASSPPDVGEDVPGGMPGDAPPPDDGEDKLLQIDYVKLAEYWNERTNGRFGRILRIENERKRMVRARIRMYGKRVFMEAVDRVCASEYLDGQAWFNFDWMIRPNNFDKVVSGNFDNKEKQTKDGKTADKPESRLGLGTVARPANKGVQTDI